LELSNFITVVNLFSVLTGLGFTRVPEFEIKNSEKPQGIGASFVRACPEYFREGVGGGCDTLDMQKTK
jgi:hypothetical protein